MKQTELLKKESKSYGGTLLNTRKGRSGPRPLDTRNSMHLVLRSSKAKGEWSFKKPQNEAKIRRIIGRFSVKYGVKILSLANVGNHLHFQIKISNRYVYKPFIRAITAAIAMSVTGMNRWNRDVLLDESLRANPRSPAAAPKTWRFWDYRPFTRVVQSFRAFLNLRDYIEINQFEGLGASRMQARYILASEFDRVSYSNSE